VSQPGGRPARPGRRASASQWRELADLPFAAALMPHLGSWQPGAEYDCAHFDQITLNGPDGSSSRFLECALTHVSCHGGQLRRATFTDTWLADVRLTGTGLAESAWTGVQIVDSAIAGAEAFGVRLRGVVLRGCKLDSVNLSDAALTDVVFDNCLLRDVDFTGATLTRSAFPGCRLTGITFVKASLDAVDLRGAELGITADPGSLRGMVVTRAQFAAMADLLADTLGITVESE
jgi:uncharacterized protein YjbI with pentapeptide repeats